MKCKKNLNKIKKFYNKKLKFLKNWNQLIERWKVRKNMILVIFYNNRHLLI